MRGGKLEGITTKLPTMRFSYFSICYLFYDPRLSWGRNFQERVKIPYFSNSKVCRHREALRKGKLVNCKVFNFNVINIRNSTLNQYLINFREKRTM